MESFNVSLTFLKKWFAFVNQIWHFKALNQYSMAQKIWFGLLTDFKTSLRKLKYRDKVFEEFQGLLCFLKKLVLYSSTKFGILKIWTNIPFLKRFELGFNKLQNKFIGNSRIARKFLESFKICLGFPGKWFCIRQPNLAFSRLEPIFRSSKDSI